MDAVDVHGEPFFINDVNFTTGDDNVAVHANNTLVEDIYFGTGHGASIGSLVDTTAGCKIKAHPGASGRVSGVTYEDIRKDGMVEAIDVSQCYSAKEGLWD